MRTRLTPIHAKSVGLRAIRLLQAHRDKIEDREDIVMLEDLQARSYDALKANRWYEDELERLEVKLGVAKPKPEPEPDDAEDDEDADYDELVEKYNELVGDYNKLSAKTDRVIHLYNGLLRAMREIGLGALVLERTVVKRDRPSSRPLKDVDAEPHVIAIKDRTKLTGWVATFDEESDYAQLLRWARNNPRRADAVVLLRFDEALIDDEALIGADDA